MNNIFVNGHSFGGATSLAISSQDKRVKACLALDPWWFPHKDEYDKIKFKVPVQLLHSETYKYWNDKKGFAISEVWDDIHNKLILKN